MEAKQVAATHSSSAILYSVYNTQLYLYYTRLGGGGIPLSLLFHPLLVSGAVFAESLPSRFLSWRVWVWVGEKLLDPQHNLLQRDRWSPVLGFIQDRQAHSATGIHIWMVEASWEHDFWRLRWIFLRKGNAHRVGGVAPEGICFTWNSSIPVSQI